MTGKKHWFFVVFTGGKVPKNLSIEPFL